MKRIGDTEFDRPWLLLCEGEADRVFFNLLLKDIGGIADKFIVRFPSRDGNGGGGRSKFGPYLANIVDTSATYRSYVKAVLIVSDSDEDADASFKEVQKSLEASNKLAMPRAPNVFGKLSGQLDIYVIMIPAGRPGRLETWCIDAAYTKWPIKEAVEKFASDTGAARWSPAKLEKMKIHSIIASTCENNPEASLSAHWREDPHFHIPVRDSVFDEIRTAVSKFTVEAPT